MTKTQIAAILTVVLAGAASLWWQHRTNMRLRTELADVPALRAENARLRTENRQLASATAPAPTAAARTAAGIGSGVTTPGDNRDGRRPLLAGGLVPIESLAGAGRATPRAAFATQLWAARTGDVTLEAAAITLSPEGRAKLEALMAKLPSDVRAQYEPPERLMALALAASPRPVGGMAVLGETEQGPDDVTLQTAWQHADDTFVHHSDVAMHRDADGWKMVVPEVLVDRAAAFLVRRTGG